MSIRGNQIWLVFSENDKVGLIVNVQTEIRFKMHDHDN